MSTITIDVKVNNTSSGARLKRLHRQVEKVGKATDDVAKSFVDFNRTVFGATAFLGIFTQAFQGLANTMMQGSELDRASKQFGKRFGSELPAQMQKFDDGTSAVIGPQGRFIQNIRSMTTNSIDMMAAMKSAIQLRSAGVSGDINTLSEIVVRAGTAAKMAGKDSAEGIRRVTDFMKDGSLAHLQHLGLLREVNPELKAQLAILGKATGVLSTAVTSSFKLALGMRILRDATKGQLKGQRDLRDTLQDTAQYFDILRRTVGTFLGTAIQPMLEHFIDFSSQLSFILEDIKANKKEILFLAKAFIIGTSAVAAFVLVVGGLRLGVKALTSLVGGIPFLTIAMTALGAAVLFNKTSMKGLIDVARTLGAVVQGSFQLISSFLDDPENFAKGIGKMDKSIHDLLKKKGLLGLVQNISRVGSVISVFVRNTVSGFLTTLDSMLSKLGSVGERLKDFLGMNSGPWARKWLDAAKTFGEAFGKITAGVLGLWGALKLLRAGGSMLGGVPILGKLFGGGSSDGKPKGTKGDPIYVTDIGSMMRSVGGSLGGLAKAGGKKAADVLGITYAGKYMRVMAKKTASDGAKIWKKSGKWVMKESADTANLASRVVRSNFDKFGGNRAVTATRSTAAKGFSVARTALVAGVSRIPGAGKISAGAKSLGGVFKKGGGAISKVFKMLASAAKPVIGVLGKLAPVFRLIMPVLGSIARFTMIGTVIAVVGTAIAGLIDGLVTARKGISDFVSAFSTMIGDLFESNTTLKGITDGFKWVFNAMKSVFAKIYSLAKAVGVSIGEWAGNKAQLMHDKTVGARQDKAFAMVDSGQVRLPTGPRNKDGQAIIPQQPKDHVTSQATIMASIAAAEGDKRDRMTKAFTDALDIHSPGDANITPEEWSDIYAAGMDKSKKMNELTKDNKKTKDNTDKGVAGSTRQGVC